MLVPGQVGKAMEVIPKALAELRDSPSVNFAIANIYGKMERYEDAEKHFLRAIELFEINVQPIHYSNLGKHTFPFSQHLFPYIISSVDIKAD